MVRGMCSRSTGRQYTTTCPASVSGVWSERFFARAARRCSPMPLCDALDCVHLHNEGSHQGLLSLRGPLVSSDIAGRIDPRVSFCLLVLTEKLCHFHTLLLFTCYDDCLSLVIVTCFAMSFALRSAAIARLTLDASLWHGTRELPTLLNFARSRLSAG